MPITRTHAVDDLVRQVAARRELSISRRTTFASVEGQAVAADTPNFLDPTWLQILVVNEQDVPLLVPRS